MTRLLLLSLILLGCAESPPDPQDEEDMDDGGVLVDEPTAAHVHVLVHCAFAYDDSFDESDSRIAIVTLTSTDDSFGGKRECDGATTSVTVHVDVPGEYSVNRSGEPNEPTCTVVVGESDVDEGREVPSCYQD